MERTEPSILEVREPVSTEKLTFTEKTGRVPKRERTQQRRGGGEPQTSDTNIEAGRFFTISAGGKQTGRALATRKNGYRQPARKKLRIFQSNSSKNLEIGEMSAPCGQCASMRWSGERIVGSSKQASQFSVCCQKGRTPSPFLCDPSPLLQQLVIA